MPLNFLFAFSKISVIVNKIIKMMWIYYA